jgi:hypothetical protein
MLHIFKNMEQIRCYGLLGCDDILFGRFLFTYGTNLFTSGIKEPPYSMAFVNWVLNSAHGPLLPVWSF